MEYQDISCHGLNTTDRTPLSPRLPEVLRSLKRAGYGVPEDIGVAYHSLDEKSRCLSGMKKNSWQIGVMAVDLLIDMLHRNERGIPARPYLLMVEGSWVEGNTLRKPSERFTPRIPFSRERPVNSLTEISF